MDYQIVPIAEEHILGFRAVVDSVARERRYLAMLRGFPIKETRQFVRASVKKGNPHFVALARGRVIGWCDIQPVPRDTMAHGGILGMGVVKGFRGKSVGDALMAATLKAARRFGLTRVELTVREDNLRAKRLYEKHGFALEGRKRNAFRVGGRYYDLLSMAVLFERGKAS